MKLVYVIYLPMNINHVRNIDRRKIERSPEVNCFIKCMTKLWRMSTSNRTVLIVLDIYVRESRFFYRIYQKNMDTDVHLCDCAGNVPV